MGEVVKRISQLPATTEELQKFILIGKQVLAAHKAKLKAIQQATEAHVAQEAALVDTQDIAEILLYAEAKLGALIPKPVYAKEIGSPGRTYSLPVGVTKKQSHYAGPHSPRGSVRPQRWTLRT